MKSSLTKDDDSKSVTSRTESVPEEPKKTKLQSLVAKWKVKKVELEQQQIAEADELDEEEFIRLKLEEI
jgi:hypothetical protein